LSAQSTGASVSSAIVAADGGTLMLTTPSHTYRLEISPGALAANTEIGLEEVTVDELPGAVAVRFSPDGLVFEVPALLSVDAPYDEPMLGLAFEAGTPGVEMVAAAPLDGGRAMAIEHFSEAAFTPPEAATPALDEEQKELAAQVASVSESKAYGLGYIYRGRLAELIQHASVRIAELDAASKALTEARAEMALASVENHNAQPSGPPTVLELDQQAQAEFERQAQKLYENLTKPTCFAGADVVAVEDWAYAVEDLRTRLQVLGLDPSEPRELCLTSRISVASSPATLTPETNDVVLDTVALELVGPGSSPAVQKLGGAVFDFTATGATGPSTLTADATGIVTNVHFTRPPAPDRPSSVEVVVTGRTTQIDLGKLPPPPPQTVIVSAPASYSGVVSTHADCASGFTSATTDCDGQPNGCNEVRDVQSLSVMAGLRLTNSFAAFPQVEVTDVHAIRYQDHEVCERHHPSISDTLDAVSLATATRQPDGRLLVRLCGPALHREYMENLCVGPDNLTEVVAETCFDLTLRPEPAGASPPERYVPEPPTELSCAPSPSASGELTKEP
jgi:hypothetical protein